MFSLSNEKSEKLNWSSYFILFFCQEIAGKIVSKLSIFAIYSEKNSEQPKICAPHPGGGEGAEGEGEKEGACI